MTLEKQYEELNKLKDYINARLSGHDKQTIVELIKYLDKNDIFLKLVSKDTQLGMLTTLFNIWINEKTKYVNIGNGSWDVLEGINSLKDVENRYLSIELPILRFETSMDYSAYLDGIAMLVEGNVSPIAMFIIGNQETIEKEENMLMLEKVLRELGVSVYADIVHMEACDKYANN